MTVEVRRGADRFVTRSSRLCSRHSFSFGEHYDPANVGHGRLLAHNDDLVLPGGGYDTHRHRDVEIVTWVVSGALAHEDSTGQATVITPGMVQRTSAGVGVLHAERNASGEQPLRFVQMWLAPDRPGAEPSYEQRRADLSRGELVTVASGRADRSGVVRIGNRHASLHVARLDADDAVALPGADHLHVYVATGAARLEGAGALAEGDAARLTDAGPRRLAATAPGTEVLVWEMDAAR